MPSVEEHADSQQKHVDSLFDTGLLDPKILQSTDAVTHTANLLVKVLTEQRYEDAAFVLDEVLKRNDLLPFLASAHVGFSSSLLGWINANYPVDAVTYPSSFAARVHRATDTALLRLPPYAMPGYLTEVHKAFTFKERALEATSGLEWTTPSAEPVAPPEEEDTGSSPNKRKKKSQKERKRAQQIARKAQEPTTVSAEPFIRLGYPIPTSPEEADTLARTLLDQQKATLKIYFDLLLADEVKPFARGIYTGKSPAILKSDSSAPSVHSTNGHTASLLDGSDSTDIPLAYPSILPLRAAQFFENAEELGEWQILVSGRAINHLRQHRHDQTFEIIRKKIKELSQGFFSASNQKRLVGTETEVPIFEAKLSRDLRIVYQVDCISGLVDNSDKQILRIYGIQTHAQFDNRLWDAIASQSRGKSREYVRRCVFRTAPYKPDKYVTPAIFSHANYEAEAEAPVIPKGLSDSDFLEMHAILALDKFVPLSQFVMNSILADKDASHVFQPSALEQDIIRYPSSVFVLGRSGTGKTTTMLFRMLGMEKAAQFQMPLRQLFVTQSSVLANRVREYYYRLRQALIASNATNGTSHTDGSETDAQDLMDLAGEDDTGANLPSRFSELTAEHFPLFLTFDTLCKMLEADYNLEFGRPARSQEQRRAHHRYALSDLPDHNIDLDADEDDGALPGADKVQLPNLTVEEQGGAMAGVLTFEIFLADYWPHFHQNLKKGLDSALVWNEFMGVIKGSEMTLGTPNGYLDRQAYMKLSHRTNPTFANSRDRIYSLFELYLARKRETAAYDVADRTHALLRAMEEGVNSSQKIQYLYIDEAQDNLIIDARLLRNLSSNPNGFFWAGDTAQTISVGSSFRFDDLKAFLFRTEMSDPLVAHGVRDPIHPEAFHLAVNYRSHGGIIDAAASIIELITEFFPNSIDVLTKERGSVPGPKPIVFTDADSDAVRYEQFLFGESTNRIEFGAEQCILVRNDAAREALRRQVGELGLIMTPYEAKGLEFSDVLLYNFFKDSPAGVSEWRVVLNSVSKSKLGGVAAPRFDETRHSVICSELKFLYVCITRARNHCWIWDDSGKGESMRHFWESRNQIQVCTPSDPIPTLAVKSTPQEWGKQGRKLFEQKLYTQAIFCFDKADLPLETALAKAFQLRQKARATPTRTDGTGAETRTEAFSRAGQAFYECANLSSGQSAAKRFSYAAACFVEANNNDRAGDSYLGAGEYDSAAIQYWRAGNFDKSVEVVQKYRSDIAVATWNEVIRIARIYYFREKQLKKAESLFDNIDEMLEFLEESGFDSARVDLLEQMERYAAAAELSLQEGNPLEAVRLFTRAGDSDSYQRAAQTILRGLWSELPLGATNPTKGTSRKLLELGQSLVTLLVEQRTELDMFDAIVSSNSSRLLSMGEAQYLMEDLPHVALLCLDHALVTAPQIQSAVSASEVSTMLEGYDMYGNLTRNVLRSIQCDDPKLQQLLGFNLAVDSSGLSRGQAGEYKILPTSMLKSRISEAVLRTEAGDPIILGAHLSALIHRTLSKRLRQRVYTVDELARKSKFLTPCLDFALNGNCWKDDCEHHHLSQSASTEKLFNDRIRLHLQVITLLHYLDSYPTAEHNERKRYWLARFFEVLHPMMSSFGHFKHLSPGSELSQALPAIRVWIQERFYELEPLDKTWPQFLSGFLSTAILAFLFGYDERNIKRAPCLKLRMELRHPGADFSIVQDALICLRDTSILSINSGTIFTKQIIKVKIPIEAHVLIHFIERLTAITIINMRLQNGVTGLHDLLIPLSWISPNSGLTDRSKDRGMPNFGVLFQGLIGELLNDLWNAEDYLLLDGQPIISRIHLNLFISRICRALILFGCNFVNTIYPMNIARCIQYLDRPGRTFPPNIAQFVKAKDWKTLASALRRTWPRGKLDELVQLQMDGTANLPPLDNVKILRFSTLDGLRAEVSGNKPALAASLSSKLSGSATTIAADDNSHSQGPARTEPTEDEIKAAKTIQWHFRNHNKPQTSQMAASNLFFEECLRQTKLRAVHRNPRYVKLFLGPLPHILVCLQVISQTILKAKAKAKEKFLKAAHQELTNTEKVLNSVNKLIKRVNSLRKDLGPTSAIHREQSIEKLKKLAGEVPGLVEECEKLEPGFSRALRIDLYLGLRGIVEPAKVKPKENLPDVNMESDGDEYFSE